MSLATVGIAPPRAARGFGAMAVSPNELASQAAIEIIAGGGTAVDGAIAANAVLGVVLPTDCGLGGDLFAMVHRPGDRQPLTLNATGKTGRDVLRDVEALRASGAPSFPLQGPLPITIPGCLDGWVSLSDAAGQLPLSRVLAPAIRHAEEGFPVSRELVDSLSRNRDVLSTQPPAEYLYPSGAIPRPGDRIRRPDLARTMGEIATGGREAFYLGRPGEGVVAATEGRIDIEDLALPAADWFPALGIEVFDHTAWTTPPNSQGYLTLAALWLVEQIDPPNDPHDPLYHHFLIEAYRAVAWERDHLVTDPGHLPIDPTELCDPNRLRSRLDAISADGLAIWPDSPGGDGGTVFLAVVDPAGTGVALISSIFAGVGSGLAAGDSGVLLQNRGASFSLVPGHVNEVAPHKRTMHTLSPTLWTIDGRLAMLLGTRGGHTQPQIMLQVASGLRHLGLGLPEAQAFPRWTLDGFQAADSPSLAVENRMPATVLDGLRAIGHDLEETHPFVERAGPVAIITVDARGLRTGAADPRVEDAAPALS